MQLISPSSMTTNPSANPYQTMSNSTHRSSNTCSSTNNNHRHNVPSTTTNCQTISQASNQLSTSYGKYSSE